MLPLHSQNTSALQIHSVSRLRLFMIWIYTSWHRATEYFPTISPIYTYVFGVQPRCVTYTKSIQQIAKRQDMKKVQTSQCHTVAIYSAVSLLFNSIDLCVLHLYKFEMFHSSNKSMISFLFNNRRAAHNVTATIYKKNICSSIKQRMRVKWLGLPKKTNTESLIMHKSEKCPIYSLKKKLHST